MGDPRYPRRVWRKPKRPLNYNLKVEELRTLGGFGLRTKRELWKARTELSRLRQQARSLLALGKEAREEREPVLMRSLEKIGLVSADASLDDVLNLQVRDILSRRLQSVVMKKMDFRTPYQARQAVVHGHVMIGDRIVDVPSYTVTVKEEPDVRLVPDSALAAVLAENKRQASAEAAKAEQEAKNAEDSAPEGSAAGDAPTDGLQKAGAPDHSAEGIEEIVPAEAAKEQDAGGAEPQSGAAENKE